jgi:hypothetical protein
MNRVRVSAAALSALLATAACSDTQPVAPARVQGQVHTDVVVADSTQFEGGGWAGSGHNAATSTDTVTRGGGWAGSGH